MHRLPVLLLLLALPTTLSAQSGPRQLSAEELTRLRKSVDTSRDSSALAAQRAMASRQQEELRRQEEERLAQQQAWEQQAYDDEPPIQAPAPGIFEAFVSGFQGEVQKQREQDAQQQRFLEDLRRQTDAITRQRQQEQERQRLAEEHARQQRLAQQQRQQAAPQNPGGGAGQTTPGSASVTSAAPAAAQQQAARAQEEKLRANVAMERQRQQQIRDQQEASRIELERKRAVEEKMVTDRQRVEEQRRLASAQATQQAEQSLRTTFRGAAITCPGGGKDVLYLRSSSPPKTGCNVGFEARCPGTATGNGVHFSQANYIGASCGFGDSIRIGHMACPADQVRVDMTQATCS